MSNVRTAVRILVVEDEPGVRNLISLALKHQGYSADFAEDTADAAARLHSMRSRYSAVLVDIGVNGSALALIEEARQGQTPIPFIGLVTSANCPERSAVDEVIEKPVTGEKLRAAIQRCLPVQRREPGQEEGVVVNDSGLPSSVWRNEMQPLIRNIAAADIPVLVQGETGAGKEVLARQIHALSARSKKPFLKVNCAALPSELIESELFGYERGAFTGAFKTTPGKFEMADGGTILLDEIGDMDFKLQAKLLQVLQDSEFIRLGSSEPRRVDVRVIAATHCDLERAIAEGRFREDLYYRLNIVTVHVPPLRDRKDEILPLTYHFLRKHATQTTPPVEILPALREVLLSHDWPGNIRELENVIRRLLVLRRPDLVAEDIRLRARRRNPAAYAMVAPMSKEPVLSLPSRIPAVEPREETGRSSAPLQMLPPVASYRAGGNGHEDIATPKEHYYTPAAPTPIRPEEVDGWSVLDRVDQARREAETEAILQALNSTLWNRKRAAELLNIDYKALLYKMKKLGIAERATKIAI